MSSLSPSFNVLPSLHWLRGGAAALVGSQWRLRGCRWRWQCGRADPPTPLLSPFFLFCPFSPLSFPSLAVFFSLSFFAVSFPLSPLWFFFSPSLVLSNVPWSCCLKMKTKLRVISAVIERRFFLSFCYCFHSCTLLLLCFWFSEMKKTMATLVLISMISSVYIISFCFSDLLSSRLLPPFPSLVLPFYSQNCIRSGPLLQW